jgi:hypothetical protein
VSVWSVGSLQRAIESTYATRFLLSRSLLKSPGNLPVGGEGTACLVEWVGRDELRLRRGRRRSGRYLRLRRSALALPRSLLMRRTHGTRERCDAQIPSDSSAAITHDVRLVSIQLCGYCHRRSSFSDSHSSHPEMGGGKEFHPLFYRAAVETN